ncbi:hypothetical protein MNBD_GAMMA09-1815 [hydrothermal vent metagenome]|uniref:Thioesterase putative domain-containing protein n=1 Tax=hydrothermal vent metagenome TaxID=652676 RepID=A0A3B0YIT6_9ZZZZ
MLSAHELQQVLHNEIPLTQTIGIQVTECSPQRIELTAPLEPNINHKCTAFGGSLYSVAVLCGWSYVYQQMKLNQLTGHIVIQSSEVNYLQPVDGDIRAICEAENSPELKRFSKIYRRKGRARIHLQVKILFNNRVAVDFNGQYVVHC